MPSYEFGGIPESGNGEHVMVLSDFMDRDFSHHLLSFHGIAVYDFFFFFSFSEPAFFQEKNINIFLSPHAECIMT